MTSAVTIGYPYTSPTITADLSNLGVSVTHLYTNPVIVIPTPITNTVGASAIGWNIKGLNIGFLINRFSIKFTILDGMGTMNFDQPSTIYEKIQYMANRAGTKGAKALTINGYKMAVQIESFNITFAAGQKDMAIGCTLNVIAIDPSVQA